MGIESVDVLLALGGLVAGLMVGLTGMGGAALVTPMLIVGFGIPAAAAVSSDVVAAAFVKPVGALVHARRGTVHWRLVQWLSLGAVPGVLLGTLLFSRLLGSVGLDGKLQAWIGVVLLVALVAMLVKSQLLRRRARIGVARAAESVHTAVPVKVVPTLLLGLTVGVLVGTTSVGSGSLVVTLLLLMYPLLRPSMLVGTDLVQAVPLLIAGAIAHIAVGVVDWRVTAALLVGQIPGVWLGARVSSRYNGLVLRYLLMVIIAATALKLLGVSTLLCSGVAVGGLVVVGVVMARERAARRVDLRRGASAEAAQAATGDRLGAP